MLKHFKVGDKIIMLKDAVSASFFVTNDIVEIKKLKGTELHGIVVSGPGTTCQRALGDLHTNFVTMGEYGTGFVEYVGKIAPPKPPRKWSLT